MAIQIRIYTINKGALKLFANEWDEKIRPLREKIGFRVPGAWTIEATNQFVWLMEYDGPDSWDALDKAYFDSDERRDMDPNPGRLIARMEQYFMEPVKKDDRKGRAADC
jgi:hypothetical protein